MRSTSISGAPTRSPVRPASSPSSPPGSIRHDCAHGRAHRRQLVRGAVRSHCSKPQSAPRESWALDGNGSPSGERTRRSRARTRRPREPRAAATPWRARLREPTERPDRARPWAGRERTTVRPIARRSKPRASSDAAPGDGTARLRAPPQAHAPAGAAPGKIAVDDRLLDLGDDLRVLHARTRSPSGRRAALCAPAGTHSPKMSTASACPARPIAGRKGDARANGVAKPPLVTRPTTHRPHCAGSTPTQSRADRHEETSFGRLGSAPRGR
jgi:hypothetical protein